MILRPSGGLLYHWRAWRSKRTWRPFTEAIADWLSTWQPSTKELILLGPSAGYTLPTPWLNQFEIVYAYDLDTLAPWLFRRRHTGVSVQFEQRNVFWRDARLNIEALREILRAHPRAAVLFSNVLGQVLLEGAASETEWQTYLGQLRESLSGREWASYHDRLTFEANEVIDHLTGGEWKQGLPARQFSWQLHPKSRHEIEGVICRRENVAGPVPLS